MLCERPLTLAVTCLLTTQTTVVTKRPSVDPAALILPNYATNASVPLQHVSYAPLMQKPLKKTAALCIRISAMRRKFQRMQKEVTVQEKTIMCRPMTGSQGSLPVTVLGVTSKTGQQQLAELQSAAPVRGSEAFEFYWTLSPLENSTVSLQD